MFERPRNTHDMAEAFLKLCEAHCTCGRDVFGPSDAELMGAMYEFETVP